MLGQAIALGLVSALGRLDGRILGISMFDRPIVTATLAGLILGDPVKGSNDRSSIRINLYWSNSYWSCFATRYCYRKYIATSFAIISGQSHRSSFSVIRSNSNVWIDSWNCNKDN